MQAGYGQDSEKEIEENCAKPLNKTYSQSAALVTPGCFDSAQYGLDKSKPNVVLLPPHSALPFQDLIEFNKVGQ